MTYDEAIAYLYAALPMYQRDGKSAFKKDLTNTLALCEHLNNPQQQFKSIHVAGTNGKGSSCHMLASILQSAGYKVGLYTSPHLKSFTERIRINGDSIAEETVATFVISNKSAIESVKPSFFEITVAMAFDYFAKEAVDVAVIEVGLGGRLDSTNVITPEVSLITNIGYDHMDFLGETLPEIAREKAGIIKSGIPVVVSEYHSETYPVFEEVSEANSSEFILADDSRPNAKYKIDLQGKHQQKNLLGVLQTVDVLNDQGWGIQESHILEGLKNITANTGLKGRWQKLQENPLIICDTGHNKEAFHYIIESIENVNFERLILILGFVNDKNVADLLRMLPSDAEYIFCQADIPRAMSLAQVKSIAENLNIQADYIKDVNQALDKAKSMASMEDFIFVGGSTFVVAEIDAL